MTEDQELVRVLSAHEPDGVEWEIRAGDDLDEKFLTMLWRRSGGRTAQSGFSGPKLPAGRLVNHWTGQADGTPSFVMVRTAPEVESVTAVGRTGAAYPLTMSDVVERFGLRFGAAAIPAGEEVVEIRTVPPTEQIVPRPLPTGAGRSAH
jgi:hypothetical protein